MKPLIRLYYGFQIFFSLLLWIPIYYEYQKRIGLSDTQIFEIQSIYYIAFCLLEIPTGLIGDRLGYRFCMRLGAMILVGCNLLPVLFHTYTSFLLHFLLIALSRSLISGASSAYLYDGLKAAGAESSEYKRVEGNSRSYGLIGKVLIWPFIGPLMEWHLSAPYVLTVVGAVIAVACSLRMPPDAASDRPPANGPMQVVYELGQVLRSLPRTPIILLLMVQGLAAFILPRILQTNLFQPILHSKGFSVSSYGLLLAAASVFEALGSGYPFMKWVLKRIPELAAVSLLSLVLAASLAMVPFSAQIGTAAALFVFCLAAGMIFPVQMQLINDAISTSPVASGYRATVLSMNSIFDRAVCAWVVSWIGVFVSQGRIDSFLWIAAFLCAVGIGALSVVLYGFKKRDLAYRVT